MNKEYVFIGGRMQGKTRDLINQIIAENKDLNHQLEEKDKVFDEAINFINNTVVAEYGSEEIIHINELWFIKELLEILERGKNEI